MPVELRVLAAVACAGFLVSLAAGATAQPRPTQGATGVTGGLTPPGAAAPGLPQPATPATIATDRPIGQRMPEANGKAMLERRLSLARSRDEVIRRLKAAGWAVSAINQDDAEAVEYEVVDGRRSYEVRIEFAADGRTVAAVDVKENLWLADSTERALREAGAPEDGEAPALPD